MMVLALRALLLLLLLLVMVPLVLLCGPALPVLGHNGLPISQQQPTLCWPGKVT